MGELQTVAVINIFAVETLPCYQVNGAVLNGGVILGNLSFIIDKVFSIAWPSQVAAE